MALRSLREGAIQTLAFEAGGLALAAPLYWLIYGGDAEDSLPADATRASVVSDARPCSMTHAQIAIPATSPPRTSPGL